MESNPFRSSILHENKNTNSEMVSLHGRKSTYFVSRSNTVEQLEFKLAKLIWGFRNLHEYLENNGCKNVLPVFWLL